MRNCSNPVMIAGWALAQLPSDKKERDYWRGKALQEGIINQFIEGYWVGLQEYLEKTHNDDTRTTGRNRPTGNERPRMEIIRRR